MIPQKTKTVFILGAGASADAGLPLMNNFFDKAKRIFKQFNSLPEIVKNKEHFERVFNFIADLQPIYAKAFLDLDNIETLFGALEMAEILERLGDKTLDEIAQIKKSLIKVIIITIEFNTNLYISEDEYQSKGSIPVLIRSLYKGFDEKFRRMFCDFSFITFNYDLVIDYALRKNGLIFNYFLNGGENIPLLKLHGSVNWIKNNDDDAIHIAKVNERMTSLKGTDILFTTIGANLIDDYQTPVIVPPTWNKSQHQKTIKQVWQKAATELAEAEILFIIGYSLPESDMFFRYLYGLGTFSDTHLNRIIVINPDKNTEVAFRNMIGQGILSRRFEFWESTLEKKVSSIHDTIARIINQ
jgi:hypothetical protein